MALKDDLQSTVDGFFPEKLGMRFLEVSKDELLLIRRRGWGNPTIPVVISSYASRMCILDGLQKIASTFSDKGLNPCIRVRMRGSEWPRSSF